VHEKTHRRLWRFVRGDDEPEDFARWLYQESTLEAQLGEDLYLDLIMSDLRSAHETWSMRERLGAHLRSAPGPPCYCIRLRDLDVVDWGRFAAPAPAFEDREDRDWSHEDVMDTLEEVGRRGDPHWWLWAARCTACGQGWLVGSEERQNDLFCLRRLDDLEQRAITENGQWPADFDRYERLLELGHELGRSVVFESVMGSSLEVTMADLARERPGIGVRTLARLLNLDIESAIRLARRASRAQGVTIKMDAEPSR
jgi:hypothetical protein